MTVQPTAPAVLLTDKQREAFEALVKHGTQPKAVNTAQALLRRGLVEIDPEGDVAVTPTGWDYAVANKITSAGRAPFGTTKIVKVTETSKAADDAQADDEQTIESAPVEDEQTTEDKAKTPKAAKVEKTAEQTLRFPVQFIEHLRAEAQTKRHASILTRVDESDAVDPKDDSVRTVVSDADLDFLLSAAKRMVDGATDGSAKRVANGRVRWIEKMLAAKR